MINLWLTIVTALMFGHFDAGKHYLILIQGAS